MDGLSAPRQNCPLVLLYSDYLGAGVLCCTRTRARICKPFKEPRNRFPAWRNRFLGSLNVYKYGLCIIENLLESYGCTHIVYTVPESPGRSFELAPPPLAPSECAPTPIGSKWEGDTHSVMGREWGELIQTKGQTLCYYHQLLMFKMFRSIHPYANL